MNASKRNSRPVFFSRMMFRAIGILFLVDSVLAAQDLSADEYLSFGDGALSREENQKAIGYYKEGIDFLTGDESLLTVLSLETNLATALSSVGLNEEAVDHYQTAISTYSEGIENIDDHEIQNFAKDIASQASFFMGMTLQDLGEPRKAVEAYGYAIVMDPNHWASLANLGSVLHDDLRNHDEALQAYNRAYTILTQTDGNPTDPPAEPRFILSQLQYRIGLCLNHDLDRKCALSDDPEAPVSCKEMASHAFSLAVKFDPENESAKHMLATITADATMKRASNTYVKTLFDDYAQK